MPDAQPKKASMGGMAALAVVAVLIVIGLFSEDKKPEQSFVSPSLSSQISAMPAPTNTPIEPLNIRSVRKARQHLSLVMQAEGISGAMIYSQNCYDALSRSFSWPKLDLCGGFDMLAVQAVEVAETDGLSTEVEYFGPEQAAGRYLAVATKGGQEPGDTDKRLETLQRRTVVQPKPQPISTDQMPTEDTSAPDEAEDVQEANA